MDFQDKHVLVYGAGKSGIGACDLLAELGARPVLFDENTAVTPESMKEKLAHPELAEILSGELTDERIRSLDFAVLSPGVPTDLPNVCRIRDAHVPVIGEVELRELFNPQRDGP